MTPYAATPSASSMVSRDRLSNAAKLSPGSTRSLFPIGAVERLFSSIEGTGSPLERLLLQAGAKAGAGAGENNEIACADVARLLRRARRLTRDDLWGLGPNRVELGSFSQACLLAAQGGSLEGALRTGFRAYRCMTEDFALRLVRDGDRTRIVLHDRANRHVGRDAMHILILYVLRLVIEWLSGRTGFIRRVELQYPPMLHPEAIDDIFLAPVVSDAPFTSLFIDAAMLARPVVTHATQVDCFVRTMPDRLALIFPDQASLADRAASYIRAQGDWDVSRHDVAAALNMSDSTFKRRLHLCVGAGFQELKDRLRNAAAMELLVVEHLSLDEVAHMLGFSELSSFHRAFKRWNGEGPGHFRSSLLRRRALQTG